MEEVKSETKKPETKPVAKKPEVKFDIVRDPFDQHDPFVIHGSIPPDDEFPEGQALSWKSESYRSGGRWRGWKPMTWDDPYRDHLKDCIADPPKYMESGMKVDNYIRRADLILCRIDKRIFDLRQKKRVQKSDERRRITSREDIPAPSGLSERWKGMGDGMETERKS